MTVRANETGEEEECLKRVQARHWVGATGVGKIEALRDTIFRCYDGFWMQHRELTERVVSLEAERAARQRVAAMQLDGVLGHVEGKPFTAADILRWRRMEGPAGRLAWISWHYSQFWPSSPRRDDQQEQVKIALRDLAEAMKP